MTGFEQIFAIAVLTCAAAAVPGVVLSVLYLRSRLRFLDGRLYTVAAPATVGSPDQFFMGLHGLLRPSLARVIAGQPWISLELDGRAGQVRFQMWVPHGDRPLVEALLRAAYSGVEVSPAAEPAPTAAVRVLGEFRLAHGNHLPIRTSFDAEPLSGVLWALGQVGDGDAVTLQLLVRPKPSTWQVSAHRVAQGLRDVRRGATATVLAGGRSGRSTEFERGRAKAIEEKAAGVGFDCVVRVLAATDRPQAARELVRRVAASLGPYAGANSLAIRSIRVGGHVGEHPRLRRFPLGRSVILTARELAALWHLPSEPTPHLYVVRSQKLPPPPGSRRGERILGLSTWAGERVPIGLSIADSRHHLHLLGPTGTGKTTAMLNLAAQDIAAGRGVAVLDPKGDFVRGLLRRLPRERLDDVVLISPDEGDLSVGINPLELGPGDDRDLVAENTLTIFKRIYADSWGMRTDDILKATVLTLLRRPDSTLAQITLLLTDPAFRMRAVRDLGDPVGLDSFWQWFERLSETRRSEAIGPVSNKLRDFLVRPKLRRLLCQTRSTVDLRTVVDSGQILLADLSVGRWGETTSGLIGSFLVAKLWQAVLARSAMEEEQRRDFFLYLDEFQHFLGIAGPFADALAQARSLRLSLTIANQHLGQLPRDVREAVSSNARSRVVFQCGQDDAAYLAREFAPLDATALLALPRFAMAARLSIGGETSQPFTLNTIAPSDAADPAIEAAARHASLSRYGRPVDAIDRELRATLAPLDRPPTPTAGVGRTSRR